MLLHFCFVESFLNNTFDAIIYEGVSRYQNFLTPINRWTKEEAHGMGYKRFRFQYVPKEYHELLKVDGDPLAPISARQEKMIAFEKSIDEKTQTQMQSFALKYTDLFINIISSNYPLSYSLFDKYKNKLNWIGLSNNPYLPWSIELIEKYADKWDWKILTNNHFLPWTTELLEKYKDKWDWTFLLVKKENWKSFLEELWDCRQWSDDFTQKIDVLLGYNRRNKLLHSTASLSAKRHFTKSFLAEKQLDSDEEALKLVLLLGTDLDETGYLLAKSRIWKTKSFENFRKYESGKMIWRGLSANEQISWSLELIEKYMDKWDINELARNKSVYDIFKLYLNDSLIVKILTEVKQ